MDWKERTALLLGEDKMTRLAHANVLVVGVGGVGAYAAEMICRAGVGNITLVDGDTIQPSNINRQLPALHSTVGLKKAEVLAKRFTDINSEVMLHVIPNYLTEEDMDGLLADGHFDFVVDAIDTIAPKCALLSAALRRKVPVVSSMGAGAKTDAGQVRTSNLWTTFNCPLSKAVRHRLTQMGLKGRKLPVVFCTQAPDRNAIVNVDNERNKKSTAGTVSYMPAVFGCMLANYVIMKL
jgi:tRNA A37 threonylcarbamoyladenosine dehydratase